MIVSIKKQKINHASIISTQLNVKKKKEWLIWEIK
jgi:hypothetical protein